MLTQVSSSNRTFKCSVEHHGKALIIYYENREDVCGGYSNSLTVDGSGRLVKSEQIWEDYSEVTTFSNYDSNGWPTRSKTEAETYEDASSQTYSYSALDEYGNWTRDGHSVRKIEYYPLQ